MNFYSIALLGSPLESLTYHSGLILERGLKVSLPLSNREMEGIVLIEVEKPAFKTHSILETFPFIYSETQLQIASFMSEYYGCSLGEVLNLFVPFEKLDSRLRGNDNTPVIPAKAGIQLTGYTAVNITLSPTQSQALDFIRSHNVSLLFGDTGAGKSEIYMKRMDEVLNEGKRALLLLPEISLTPQMEQRFKHHFGESFVLWHSKMTPKQKKVTLEKIYSGEARIVAGPRSALFLPIKNLGLIVVDEEHDESYKSSSRPRYNAR
ncbi:MAG: DEAD/DEAH box helicase, partial [Sulfuricurvum sp.]|nr:DEAD/DEAH box helicase [Sulfuricurvum sp.]